MCWADFICICICTMCRCKNKGDRSLLTTVSFVTIQDLKLTLVRSPGRFLFSRLLSRKATQGKY